MANNLEELRADNSEGVKLPEVEVGAVVKIADPVQAERQRIKEIDALAKLYDEDTINAAKYGDTACTAQEMCYRAALSAAKSGQSFLNALEEDAKASGTENVSAVAVMPGDDNDIQSPRQRKADAKANIKALLGKGE